MSNLENQLEDILRSNTGEREIHHFLKVNHRLITMAFNRAWNFHTCIPEFELGSDFRADFLILSAHSCHWHAIFIELKSPSINLYNKNGTPSKDLRLAQKQISDWREWIRVNEQYLRYGFAEILKEKNAPAIYPNPIPNYTVGYDSGAAEISDLRSTVGYYYHIVIGRSSSLLPEERKRRAMDSLQWGGPEIATYDRLLATAKRVDKTAHLYK
jgi:hypothetical protein